MSRPAGSKNKPKEAAAVIFKDGKGEEVKVDANVKIPETDGIMGLHYDAILGIRVLRNGNFKGLWELVLLDDNGNRRKVVTDANSRQMVIGLAVREIRKIVVAM